MVWLRMTPITPPERGPWPHSGFPEEVTIQGRRYAKALFMFWQNRVVEQYREKVPRRSRHLWVMDDYTWQVAHLDEYNPDAGFAWSHLLWDVILPGMERLK
jgi:hypothetical protein